MAIQALQSGSFKNVQRAVAEEFSTNKDRLLAITTVGAAIGGITTLALLLAGVIVAPSIGMTGTSLPFLASMVTTTVPTALIMIKTLQIYNRYKELQKEDREDELTTIKKEPNDAERIGG